MEPVKTIGFTPLFEFLNIALLVLAIIATIFAVRRLRGSNLALWLLVIWVLPLIGPVVSLAKSGAKQ